MKNRFFLFLVFVFYLFLILPKVPFGSSFCWSPIAPSGASSDPSDPEALLAPEGPIGDQKKNGRHCAGPSSRLPSTGRTSSVPNGTFAHLSKKYKKTASIKKNKNMKIQFFIP